MLTQTEKQILHLLGIRKAPSQIATQMEMSVATVYVHASRIREKTGITDTANAEECRKWWRENREILFPPPPAPCKAASLSQTQRRALEMLCLGERPKRIASRLALVLQSAYNAISTGAKILGIPATLKGPERLKAIRDALDELTGNNILDGTTPRVTPSEHERANELS